MENKKQLIEDLTKGILQAVCINMSNTIKKAINSGALDLENWSPEHDSMIMPKIIAITLLENEADQYKGEGTRFEKEVKKEVRNLKLFL